jgi:heterodisulfide reductase subunit A
VVNAVEFLREVNLGTGKAPGKNVVVIGGGNVAVDAARTARRLGCEKVTVVYRRSRKEMPAYEEEIEDAMAEGIAMEYLTAPVRIHENEGRVTGFECVRTKLESPDESGRQRPLPVEGSEFVIPCDAVIPAIGQLIDPVWDTGVIEMTSRNTLVVNPATMQTSLSNVFAAGDVVSGPATVIEAVGAAHRAVSAIDAYLNGIALNTFTEKQADEKLSGDNRQPVTSDITPEKRAAAEYLTIGKRSASFDEVDLGISEQAALQEAMRCLNCGVCSECMECVKVCEAKAIDHTMKEKVEEFKVGSIILTTGYDLMDPSPIKQYGYKKFANVFTSLEFERLSNATGPTGGKILIRDTKGEFTRKPRSVALLHCVGSRDVNYHEYCSRVCCMYALKYSHLIKEKVGHDTKVYDFYIDQRCFGKGYEEFYRRCQQEGTIFIRGKVAEITDQAESPAENGKLVAIAEDTLLGSRIRVPVDMVILCAAMEARKDAAEVGRIFGTNLGADGFFLEEHPKLGPLNTATDGVFIAGACQGPKDIPDTVAQASGAAAKSLSLAKRGIVQVPSAISWIDPDICIGCQQCIGLCPYSAIEFNPRLGISVVNEALCKGCGSCAGFCPSSAAQVRHFKDKQILSELDGIFDAIEMVGM